jgi:hypothetical protein
MLESGRQSECKSAALEFIPQTVQLGQDERSDNVPEPQRRQQMFFAGATATLRLVTVRTGTRIQIQVLRVPPFYCPDDPNVIRRLLGLYAESILPGKS